MTRSNRRRIVRVNQVEEANSQKEYKEETLTKDINLLLKILIFAGLVFQPLNSKKQKLSWLAHVFEVVYHIFAVFIIAVNVLFWQRRYSSTTLHFSTTLTLFLAIAVRFAMYLSRKKIPQMARDLIHLYEDVTWNKPHKSIKKTILLSSIIPVLLTTISTVLDNFHLQVMRAKEEHSIQFVINLGTINNENQNWMIYMFLFLGPVKMYFAYGVSVTIFIFCCIIYTIAKRIVLALNDQIRSHDSYGITVTSRTISVYLDFYNRLNKAVADIDEVLSPCVLLLYGLMVSGQFYTLTVLISQDITEQSSLTTAIQNAIVFLLTMVAFLVVTLLASKVNEVAEDVKRSLHNLSNKIAEIERSTINDEGIASSYLILVSILNGSHLSFTGWRMFNINRSFILTTMGVMISYGVIIVQIGRKSGNY
ncbi:hypothetical protein JTE90_008592 [Oedothorax gibbosus]|uniref:Gustatory receptor n=1 Tax=Oedothorax gibbosus TaxID=931172 RepID=A0AAV6U8B3_9ARAC|nr:hypothetical protein JTE90_008592 [Oedothorax gibbosus]